MSLKSFLKLVEIQTKVASIVPFLLGTVYSIYRFSSFNIKNFILMLISLLSIDMATTAINNYFDYKKANKKHGYNYEKHNAIVSYNLKESTVRIVIFSLLFIATLFGVLLFLNTDIIVLSLGAISFMVGIFYTYGPLPISRMPLGEVFSGFFMGFIIVFISSYIHIFEYNIVDLSIIKGIINININIVEIIYIFLLSIPTVNGIANIMLANNICDIEDDIENKRYTLPIYIGKNKALNLFKILYYMIYIDIVILVILKILPIFSIAVLLTILPVSKNIKGFYEKQTKKDTFVLSVKNFLMINIIYIFTIIIGIIF
jgi:1,4-dihydroxy-2-naphthoate octaprenyltransferase